MFFFIYHHTVIKKTLVKPEEKNDEIIKIILVLNKGFFKISQWAGPLNYNYYYDKST